MRNLILISVVCVLALNGCKKPAPEITLYFSAKFSNESLKFNHTYTDASGKRWRFEELNFYYSNLTLISESDEEVMLADLGYVDFTTQKNVSVKFKDVPKGKYKALRFNAGLTPEQNDVAPNFLDEKDVRNLGLYWGWLKYVFVKIEGRADVNNSGSFNTLLVYHIGADELLREVNIPKGFDVQEGNKNLNLTLLIDKIFTTSPTIDIANYDESYSHSDKNNKDNYPTAIKFADNFSQSFTLD